VVVFLWIPYGQWKRYVVSAWRFAIARLSLSYPSPSSTVIHFTILFVSNWVKDYSIKFNGCSSIPSFEREEGMRAQVLAKFQLCPSDSCRDGKSGSCSKGGDYVVELNDFVEAIQNAKLSANEYNCAVSYDSCEYQCQYGTYVYTASSSSYTTDDANNNNGDNNDNDNEEACIYQCMSDDGYSFCSNENEDNDMNELVECRELGEDNNNNNNNGNNNYYSSSSSSYQRYYSGAYCTSKGVFIGTFTDSTCTKKAPSGTFERYMGYSMPTDPLVTYECVSCKESNNDNENNNGNNNANNQYGDDYYDYDSVSDTCEELYEDAGKCESSMDSSVVMYKDTSSCEMIQTTLVQLDRAFNNSTRGRAPASVMFAWLFGLASVVMGAYIFVLKRQERRTNGVNLLDGTGINKWWVF
jgi:hypothetical protein